MDVDVAGTAAKAAASLAAGAGGKTAWDRLSRRHRFGHLYNGRRDRGVDLILPSIAVQQFDVRDPRGLLLDVVHVVPPNVLYMPMAEGSSIAKLAFALRSIPGSGPVTFVTSDAYAERDRPLISVGGPSGNDVSGRLLETHLPEFAIDYPQATAATLGSRTFHVQYAKGSEEVSEDWGFILVIPRSGNHPGSVVLFGILAFGTEIATQAFLELRKLNRPMARRLHDGKPHLIVAHGKVRDFRIWDVRVDSEIAIGRA